MEKRIFFLALLIMATFSFATGPDSARISSDQDLHRFVQIEGTENRIRKFFSEHDIVSDGGFLITVFLPPMGCPRCEGLISPFLNDIKHLDSTLMTAVFVFYSKSNAASHYLKERRYPADDFYILTSNEFLENFYISSNSLQVPFFVKFNLNSGDLILSKTTLGMEYDKDIAKMFSEAVTPSEKTKKKIREDKILTESSLCIKFNIDSLAGLKKNFLNNYNILPIIESDDHILSEIRRVSFSENGNYLSFMDDITNSIFVYRKQKDSYRFVRQFRAGNYEDKLFYDDELGNDMFVFLKTMNILNTMYFNSFVYNDSIFISASLPKVFYEDKDSEKIGYMNEAVFLIKNIYDENSNTFITMDTNFTDLILEHPNTCFSPKNNNILIPLSKGWPVSGHSSLPENNPATNPFIDEFYNFTPGMATFDMHGNFTGFIGTIDSIHRKYKLGYTFFIPIIKIFGIHCWFADSYSGIIHKFHLSSKNYAGTTAVIFDTPDIQTGMIPLEKGTLEYLKYFNNLLSDYIVDFTVFENRIISIIKSGDYYLLVKYDLNDSKVYDYKIIPADILNYKCKSLTLGNPENGVLVIGVYESSKESAVVEFETDI